MKIFYDKMKFLLILFYENGIIHNMKKLLVCTDGSFPYTESCLKYAEWLIRKTGASADILYVTDSRQFDFSMMSDFTGSLGVQPYQGLYAQIKQVEQEKVRLIQSAVAKFFKDVGLLDKVRFCHEEGSLVDVYQKYEDSEMGVDLVLLGKRGENANFATEHLGSTMERVVRASQRPCWVACRQYIPIKKIALAYDDSPSANHALQFLLRSQLLKDCAIELIYVCEDEVMTEEKQAKLGSVEKTLREANYQVNTTVIDDEVSDGVSNYVAKNSIDMLIMGAYGHSAIRHLLIGSTTTELMRRCKTSVLLFR